MLVDEAVIARFRKGPDPGSIRSILILYDERIIYLGDTMIRTGRVKLLKELYKNAGIDTIVTDPVNWDFCEGLLKNNPYLRKIGMRSWDEIEFMEYDLVLVVKYDEELFRQYLNNRYPGDEARINSSLFSFSYAFLGTTETTEYNWVLPVIGELHETLYSSHLSELYMTQEERDWGDEWLTGKGLKKNEKLFVIIDTSKGKDKVLDVPVYHEFLTFILTRWNCKVLIYDEKDTGKEDFYREFVGRRCFERLIFANKLSLRRGLCLLASRHVRMIFGPCTGIMHCASSIYNAYVSMGMAPVEVPLIVTYTGTYVNSQHSANLWWGQSPLVKCLILKEKANKKELIVLHELQEGERTIHDQMPCSGYDAKMLTNFIQTRLKN